MWWYRTVRTAVRVVEVTIEQASRTVWWYSRPQKGYSGCRDDI